MKCRFCGTSLSHEFVDLVNSPPSNSYLTESQLNEPEVFYPLKVFVCHECFLVQIDEYMHSQEIFSDQYAYFSSFSSSWLKHAEDYVEMMAERFHFDENSLIMEIASNDGYLLQYVKKKNIPCLGIEPTRSTATAAREKGIDVFMEFFGVGLAERLASEGSLADLIVGNNVLAHVPDLHDFVGGLRIALKPDGVITMEFPHLMQLIEQNQFDTIYHEHFSYFSFHTVQKIFAAHGLEIFDVEKLTTHGGSLRIFAKHQADQKMESTERVQALLEKEKAKGMISLPYYQDFQRKANRVKYDLLTFLLEQKEQRKSVAAYGAAAKGNTLLNYCGIKNDLISFVVDRSPHKQGNYLPGSHIPIVSEEVLKEQKPDVVLILPWNIKQEVMSQLEYMREWRTQFVTVVPRLIME